MKNIELTITNEDCMDLMARYPDDHFELAIVDPPYDFTLNSGKVTLKKRYGKIQPTLKKELFIIGKNYIDSIGKAPKEYYFKEL